MLLMIGIIHLLPVTGVLGLNQLNNVYGLDLAGNDVEILMRHRAVLFGLLGAFICYAGFVPTLQPLAFIAAFVSIASFFVLAYSVGYFNSALQRVVYADIVAAICLIVGVIFYFVKGA